MFCLLIKLKIILFPGESKRTIKKLDLRLSIIQLWSLKKIKLPNLNSTKIYLKLLIINFYRIILTLIRAMSHIEAIHPEIILFIHWKKLKKKNLLKNSKVYLDKELPSTKS